MKSGHLSVSACFLLVLTSSVFTLPDTPIALQDKFTSTCRPFNAPPKHQAIDAACGPQGDAARTAAKKQSREQNKSKNNLCATGTPVEISFATLVKLHQAVVKAKRFSFGSDGALNKNKSRSPLASVATVDASGTPIRLGEGKLVSLQAFVLEAKHDDVPLLDEHFKGESVNCHDLTLEGNDIHIALVDSAALVASFEAGTEAQKNSIECKSVTAEIIPHFRPDVWNRFDSHPKTSPAVHGLPVKGIQVRITGQLFFDGSHNPANCNPPRRRSSWEIHPVYTIEVKDGSSFISFVDWASKQH